MSTKTERIIEKMNATGMVPVFYHSNPGIGMKVIDAAYAGGARVFEFTNRGPEAHTVFLQLKEHCKQYSDMELGIGTIFDADNTSRYIAAGAEFVVSPVFVKEMAPVCNEHGKMWVPGCATLTEMVAARDCGASLIKMFPATVLGPRFVSAVKQVVPDIKLMPTGGVDSTVKSLKEWFTAGVTCVGMGSQLISPEIISGHQWSRLKEDVAALISRIQEIRQSTSKI